MTATTVSLGIVGGDRRWSVAGPLAAGQITVHRTNSYVRRVHGAGTVRDDAGDEARLEVDLRALPAGFDERPVGTIRVSHPASGLDVTAEVELSEDRGWPIRDVTYPEDLERPCIERRLVGVTIAPGVNAAAGTHRCTDAAGRTVVLAWCIDDGGTLPDTPTLQRLRRIGGPGLGADGNVMVWALAPFGDSLYAATCSWRLESYRDWEKWAFSRGPIDTSEGAEIWRYDGAWERVVAAGMGDPYNHGIRNLAVAGNRLFAITANHTNGFEIWASTDGRDWAPAMTGGFSNTENTSGRGLAVFGDHLYVGTENKDTGAEIWRAPVTDAHDEAAWARVLGDDVSRSWFADLTPFGDHLYAGSLMTHTSGEEASAETNHPGCRLLRTSDGVTWDVVVEDSFGNPDNLGVLCIAEFAGHLYVGTTNGRGAEVVRSADGVTWELVHKAAGDPQREWHAWKLHVFGGRLYLGLGRLEHVWWSGFRLVSTADGTTWTDEIEPTHTTHYGVRSMATYQDRLYLGTASFPDCAAVIEAQATGT